MRLTSGAAPDLSEPKHPLWRIAQEFIRFPLVTTCLVYLIISLFVYVSHPEEIHLFFPDDAYFYMKTAHNICAGLGVSFDGVNATNGFHPLYLFLLSGLSCLTPIVGNGGIDAVFLFDACITIIGFFFAARLAAILGLSLPAKWVFLAGLLPMAIHQDFGTEANILVTTTWAFLYFCFKIKDSWLGYFFAGLLAAFVCLSRVDTVLLVGLVSLPIAFLSGTNEAASLRRAVPRLILLLLPTFLALGAVAAASHSWFGHPSSISSTLKIGFRSTELAMGVPLFKLNPQGVPPLGIFVLGAGLFAIAALVRLFRVRSKANFVVAALGAWIIIYFTIMTLFLRGGLETWYYSLPLSISVLVAVHVLEPFFNRAPQTFQKVTTLIIVTGCISVTAILADYWMSRTWATTEAIEMSEWIKSNIPPDARIYQVDNSGITGYFSERSIINGDGLVNNWEYQDSLRGGRLPDYFRLKDISYILFDAHKANQTAMIPVTLWDGPALIIEFLEEPEQIKVVGRFVLYRIAPDHIVTRHSDDRFH